ncbi:sphingomyelin phosphodiesterase-like [Haemaphysalis longicornis]
MRMLSLVSTTVVATALRVAVAQLAYWHLPSGRNATSVRDPEEVLDAFSSQQYSASVGDDNETAFWRGQQDWKQALDYLNRYRWSDVSFSAVAKTFETGITTPETCATCELVMDLLKRNSNPVSMSLLVGLLWLVCYMQSITSTEVCTGLVKTYKDDLAYVMRTTRSSPNELCTLMFGRSCGNLTSPEHVWEITVPEKPSALYGLRTPIQDTSRGADLPPFRVLQLSDTHYDPEYAEGSLAACDEPLCCRLDSGEVKNDTDRAGRWGDLRFCDLPFRTLDNMLEHIGREHNLDFAYWTGDLPPHDVWKITREANTKNFNTTTAAIFKRLRGLPVYPVVGNHESVPPNMFPMTDNSDAEKAAKSKWLYETLASDWEEWLSPEALASVRQGGFYVEKPTKGLRLVSLNTNFCYIFNFWLFVNSTDPGGQLKWLVDELYDAEKAGDKVHLIGHIPPGIPDCLDTWSAMFHRIVERFSETVAGQFYGHTHYDEFILYQSSANRNRTFGVAFIAPSATSYSFLNPAYRIYELDPRSKLVTKHDTHFLNLTEANQEDAEPTWRLEYTTEGLRMSQAGHEQWADFLSNMENEPSLFTKYMGYTTRLGDAAAPCDDACREHLLCRWRTDRAHDYSACTRDPTKVESTARAQGLPAAN